MATVTSKERWAEAASAPKEAPTTTIAAPNAMASRRSSHWVVRQTEHIVHYAEHTDWCSSSRTEGIVERTDPKPVIARALRRERGRVGLSLTELARRAGIAKSTLSQLEAGNGNPS